MERKLRMGMIGGGKDAFIGAVHRIAANMDGLIEVVSGALSIEPAVAKESGRSLFLPEDRIYLTYEEMLEKEAALPAGQRMDFVTIVTPNFAHFKPAMLRSEEHTSELQSLMRISYAVFCLKKKNNQTFYALYTSINAPCRTNQIMIHP